MLDCYDKNPQMQGYTFDIDSTNQWSFNYQKIEQKL
jgi:hypothetical protein